MASDTDTRDELQPALSPEELGRLGHYRVLGVLGKGGMGQVFRAEDLRLKREVALKVMNKRFSALPHSRKRFLEEARAMAAVHHDNVVTIFEVGETGGTPFMAMELLSGTTLESRVASGQPQSVDWIIDLAGQLANGLSAAHGRGIVHRDIKPGNIWIEEPSGRIKVLDFGLALATGPMDSLAGRGSVIGTPGYLSPEQASGDELDDRSDLFSVGVVLYQLACGRLPFPAKVVTQQLIAILSHQPPRPDAIHPSVPAPLADLIMRLLAKEPRDRPRSADALAQEIRQTAAAISEQTDAATRLVIDAPSPIRSKSGKAAAAGKPGPADKATWMKDKRLWGAVATAAILLVLSLAFWPRGDGLHREPEATNSPPRTQEPVVLARSLDVLSLTDVPAATNTITSGEHARFKVTLANGATSAENDPRVINREARVIAQIATFLRPAGEERAARLSPGFPKKLSAAMLPPPGQSRVIDIDFVSAPLPPGQYEVLFELQSPSQTLVASTASQMTIHENLATSDLLGFDKVRTGMGRGADAHVTAAAEEGSGAGSGAGPYLELDHPPKPDPKRPIKHAYLRFDLDQWAQRGAGIDRALLLLTLEPGGLKGRVTVAAYGVTERMPQDWAEKGEGALSWESSASAGAIESYPFLGRAEFNNAGGALEKQPDEVRLFGPGLDDYLRAVSGPLVTILLVRTSGGDLPTRIVSREGNAEMSPALSLRPAR